MVEIEIFFFAGDLRVEWNLALCRRYFLLIRIIASHHERLTS